MKLLMALMGLEIGGAETHVVELSKELVRRGHEVLVASNGGAYESELRASGIRHFQIPMHRRDPRLMLRSRRMLKKLLRTEKPDLVHAHARIPAFLLGMLCRSMGIPFLTTAHWVFLVTPTLRRVTDWGTRTMAVSEDIRAYLMREYQVPRDAIHLTINGVSTYRFAPGPSDPALRARLGLGEGPVVGLVSRLDGDRSRAAETLIRVTARLREQIPGAQVLIVGGGDREARLRQLADRVNAELGTSAVVMTGARTDVPELLKEMDVFVGVSRAALEAMAAGKPVLLAGDEGYMGLFRPERLGEARASNFCCRGFSPVTEAGLLEDLGRALSLSEQERRDIGLGCREMVLKEYSVVRMTEDALGAYDALLHGPAPVQALIAGDYGPEDTLRVEAIAGELSRLSRPVRLTALSSRPEVTRRQSGLPAIRSSDGMALRRALKRSAFLMVLDTDPDRAAHERAANALGIPVLPVEPATDPAALVEAFVREP